MSQTTTAFDTAMRARIVAALAMALQEHYVFPDLAQKMAGDLEARQQRGEYDHAGSAAEFCAALTAHLREISGDKHLRVHYSSDRVVDPEAEAPDDGAEQQRYMMYRNFGIERVERLAGNVGYLNLTGFYPAVDGGQAAIAAMGLLAHTNALIVDLRANGGGDPGMVALFASYLFDEPTHLNDLYSRERDSTQHFWTLPFVPGPRFGGAKPVYVLVSSRTGSGAEEYAYDLQTQKRATIVGETTAVAAHPGGAFALEANFGVFIATDRAINPITGTDWEGTGVIPDIAVRAAEALDVAHAAALRAILEQTAPSLEGSLAAMLTRPGPAQALHDEAREALERLEARQGDSAARK
jgi:retinol-binding protein 3